MLASSLTIFVGNAMAFNPIVSPLLHDAPHLVGTMRPIGVLLAPRESAALIRPVQHRFVVDTRIEFGDVLQGISIGPQAVNDSSIDALIGQEFHAHPVQS